jgi:phage protein D
MGAIPIFQEKEPFYVPYFELRIAGKKLDQMIVHDVMQVTYRDKVDEIDSFELNINNWDAQAMKPKYEPASDKRFEKLFDPGQEIELRMGYSGNTRNDRLMLRGQIDTIEPSFTESGPMTLSVRGKNVLHKFKNKQHTWAFTKDSFAGAGRSGVRDSEIAKWLGSQPVTEKKPGLGIEVRPDPTNLDKEDEQPFVFMNNQYDILFLLELGRRNGYSVYLDYDPVKEKEFIYFGPSLRLRNVTYILAWGQSLIDFKPTLTTANQVSQVTVRGWDRKAGKPIEATVKWGDKGMEINRDQQSVAQAVEAKHEVVTDNPLTSEKQAKALAEDILRRQLSDMIKATGSTVGLPDLRAGRRLQIKNLGPRFNGDYFVTETSHTIGDSGYRTTFGARREKALEGAQ